MTIHALKALPVCQPPHRDDPVLRVTLWDRHFPNPIGLAAGFDKNAEVIAQMLGFGFGFVETGTVTPRPQQGNPRPRIFRDEDNQAIINRMGFPSIGVNGFKANLGKFLSRRPRLNGPVGINIGMNKAQTGWTGGSRGGSTSNRCSGVASIPLPTKCWWASSSPPLPGTAAFPAGT